MNEDPIELLLKETLDTQLKSVDVSSRIVKKVLDTEIMASTSLNSLNIQKEKMEFIDLNINHINSNLNHAHKNVSYLASIKNNILVPVLKTPSLFFASHAPKDSTGKPIPSLRVSSLPTRMIDSALTTTKGSPPHLKHKELLDESCTDEQRNISRMAEQDLDSNLNLVSSGIGRLKQAALVMGNEIDIQTNLIKKINQKSDRTANSLESLNNKVENLMDSKKKKKKK